MLVKVIRCDRMEWYKMNLSLRYFLQLTFDIHSNQKANKNRFLFSDPQKLFFPKKNSKIVFFFPKNCDAKMKVLIPFLFVLISIVVTITNANPVNQEHKIGKRSANPFFFFNNNNYHRRGHGKIFTKPLNNL